MLSILDALTRAFEPFTILLALLPLIGYLVIWLPARSRGSSAGNTVSIGAATVVLISALAVMAAMVGGVSLG